MKKRILGMVLCVCMVLSLITVAAFADGHVYRVVGTPELCGSSWDATDDDNRMTYNEETGRFEKVYTDVAAGSIPGYLYKIVVTVQHGFLTAQVLARQYMLRKTTPL